MSALEERLAIIDEEGKRYHAEWERYRDEIIKLNKVYPEEIERLHSVYRAEIERISKYHVFRFVPSPVRKIAKAMLGRKA